MRGITNAMVSGGGGGGGVDSFNGRTGVVTSQSGDYTQDQIGVPTTASVGQVPTVRNVSGNNVFVMETPQGVTRVQSLDLVEKDTVFNADGSITITAEDYTEDVVFNSGYITDSFTFTDGTAVTKYITFNADGSISERLGFSTGVTVSFLNGTTVTLSKGSTTLTATTNPYTFTVTDAGIWELRGIRGNYEYTEDINISPTSSVITREIILPEGSTVTPTDDVATLIYCAGINNSLITTIAGLLADSTTLTAVINSNNAIDYLVRSTSFATDICADSSAMTLIGANNYASNKLLDDATWLVAICDSSYKTSVLNVVNPVMTSNTTPEGEVVVRGSSGTENAYLAFDGDLSTEYATDELLYYYFTSPVKIRYCEVYLNEEYSSSRRIGIYARRSQKEVPSPVELISLQRVNTGLNKCYVEDAIEAFGYGVRITDSSGGTTPMWAMYTASIKFYGREDV